MQCVLMIYYANSIIALEIGYAKICFNSPNRIFLTFLVGVNNEESIGNLVRLLIMQFIRMLYLISVRMD